MPPLLFTAPIVKSEISVVAPVFNEAEGIRFFVQAVMTELERLTKNWEIILVDDGSTDHTWAVLQTLHNEDSRIKILRFSKNFGVQAAVSAGMKFANGDAVITMDSDLQHPPELISEMVQYWQQGFHSVFTIRTYSEDIGLVKRWSSSLFSKTMGWISQTSSQSGLSDYRLLDRKVVNEFNQMGENARFVRAMVSWLGFQQIDISFKTTPRISGKTKFSFTKLFQLAIDGITSFSILPLRWITATGLVVAAASLCYAVYVFCITCLTGVTTPGWPTLIVTILFLGGMQLTALGIVGEYVGRIYMETKRRPLFIIQDQFGFDTVGQAREYTEKVA